MKSEQKHRIQQKLTYVEKYMVTYDHHRRMAVSAHIITARPNENYYDILMKTNNNYLPNAMEFY